MYVKNRLTESLNIDFPLIMAPMFLVTNLAMMQQGMACGVAAAFPTLNYRTDQELRNVLDELNKLKTKITKGNYGVNLIVQRSNPYYEKHLQICVEKKVPFYITSLGNPAKVIEQAHAYGAKVFCDVTNMEHAQKCYHLGCDGFIAVGQGAGGHAGPFPLHVLVPALKNKFPDKITIAAGGIATGSSIVSAMVLGAEGVSVGTRFIACTEAKVSVEYKNAIVNANMTDIVLTEKISGTPCTIINTPYAKKIGYKQNWIERLLSTNKRTKKWFKMLVQLRGFKNLEASILPASYKTLWCAGQSVEHINDILPCTKIIDRLKTETAVALKNINAANS
jgi:nitronate monooxygenase